MSIVITSVKPLTLFGCPVPNLVEVKSGNRTVELRKITEDGEVTISRIPAMDAKDEEKGTGCECDKKGGALYSMEWMYSPEEYPAIQHDPGKCECKNELRQYRRGEKILWLCSACCLSSDIPVTERKEFLKCQR